MSKISHLMGTGVGALMNSKTALQTTAHNIANKETEGFSRQRVDQVAAPPVGRGRLQIGTGARAVRVSRINNPFLEKQITQEKASFGYESARSSALSRIEEIYNEQMNKGLNRYMADFFNAVRELSNNPESLATRSLVRDTAQFMAKDFRRVHKQLRGVQDEIDTQIRGMVEKVNQISIEIADLNKKISTVEVQGVPANDDRDRRDQLLKELSKMLNVKYSENEEGQLTVKAGGAVLVSGYSHTELAVSEAGEREGILHVYYKYNPKTDPVQIDHLITGGELGGMLQIRDQVVEDLIDKNNQMAFTMATKVNEAHVEGTTAYGQPAKAFFKQPQAVEDAARNMGLSKQVQNDVGHIAAGFKNAAGDNTVAHVIAAMQYNQVMRNGTATMDDFYNSVVGEVGIKAQRSNKTVESQRHLLQQLGKMRDSVSGVSLDEEMSRMVEYQKTYNASAKMIKTADEMIETVLGLKR